MADTDRRGARGIDVSDIPDLIKKANKIREALGELEAERAKPLSDAGDQRGLADALQKAIDAAATPS